MHATTGLRLVVPAVLCLAEVRTSRAQEIVWEVDGKADRRWMGWSVAKVSDLDGDGVSEVLVGAIDTDGLGKAKLFSGIDGHVVLDWDGPPFDPGEGNSLFGNSVDGVGDLDRDGIHDLIVGAPYEKARDSSGKFQIGAAFVYSGAHGSHGSLIYEVRGDATASDLGQAVLGLNDLTGDGIDDFLVTAPGAVDANGVAVGSVFVYSGADASLVYRVDYDRGTANDVSRTYGELAARIPDTDGDGIDEWAIATPYDADSSGKFGSYGGSVELHSGATGARLWRIFGSRLDQLGTGLAAIDDFNRDGVADVLVGAPQDFCRNGYALVASGVDGRTLNTWKGNVQGGLFGQTVSSPGDVNGDGAPEVAVTSIYVIRSGCRGDVRTTGGAFLNLFSGTSSQELYRWFAVGGAGTRASPFEDVDHDGYPEMIFSDPGYWTDDYAAAGTVRLERGGEFWLYGQSEFAGVQPFSFTMGELPGATTLLFAVTDFAGVPTFLPIDWTDFNGQTSVTLTHNIPPGLSGLVADFTSFALDGAGRAVASAPFTVTFW